MRAVLLGAAIGLVLALTACADDTANTPPDLSVRGGDMSVLSQCGHPGDVGNSKGVGQFCRTPSDCTGPDTNICSALGNGGTPMPGDTYFCTIFPCRPAGSDAGAPTDCGPMATCICTGQGCACVPNSCLGGPPPDLAGLD